MLLLLPGMHYTKTLRITKGKEVHIFGRGRGREIESSATPLQRMPRAWGIFNGSVCAFLIQAGCCLLEP